MMSGSDHAQPRLRCIICGGDMDLGISHIVPKSMELNLMAICPHCNATMGAREADFISYLASLMRASGRFSSVQTDMLIGDSSKYRIDIFAEDQSATVAQRLIVECKAQVSLTPDRVQATVNQLLRYAEAFGPASLALALPGKLSEGAITVLRSHNIEPWDAEYLVDHFASQIAERPHPFFEFTLRAKPRQISPHELLAKEIRDCPMGLPGWSLYQQLVGRLLRLCYCPPLGVPIGEHSDHSRVNRRDFILPNPAESGFWRYIRSRYEADYIIVDAKNSRLPVEKNDVLQIANYLKPQGAGMFALIFSRRGADPGASHTLRERWVHDKKMIIVLDDSHVESALADAGAGGTGTEVIQELIQTFRLSI